MIEINNYSNSRKLAFEDCGCQALMIIKLVVDSCGGRYSALLMIPECFSLSI